MKLERKPYLILFIVLIAGGVTAAYAITITLAGDASITGNLDVIGAITSPTTDTMQTDLTSLDSRVTTLEGTCVPTTEICDGLDNDCDTLIDNGFLNSGTGKYDQDVACGNCGTGALASTAEIISLISSADKESESPPRLPIAYPPRNVAIAIATTIPFSILLYVDFFIVILVSSLVD